MARLLITALVGALVLAGLAYGIAWGVYCYPGSEIVCSSISSFHTFYATSLRGSLFTGFLTLGGFLLSLKTFIVVNMKKEVFDSTEYFEMWSDKHALDRKNAGSLYQPLNELSDWLHYAILSCVLTSASQFTVGLIPHLAATLVCMCAAAFSIALLLVCLWRIRDNLKYMFKHLEKVSAAKAAKAAETKDAGNSSAA